MCVSILEELISLANKLDDKGHYIEASEIDSVIKSIAEQPIFKWKDEKGNVYITDRLGDVPEPYYAEFRDRAEQMKNMKPEPQKLIERGKPQVIRPDVIRDPNILAFQKQYNEIWDQLKNMGLRVRGGFGPRLKEDALYGPATERARKMFPWMQKILKNELRQQ
jgi:hypothetical protein